MDRSRLQTLFFLVLGFLFLSYHYIDQPLALYIVRSGINVSNHFFNAVTQLGDSKYTIGATLLLFLLYRKRQKLYARQNLYLLSVVVGSGLIVDVIKILSGRVRPELFIDNRLYGFYGLKLESLFYSFPSGHSATAFSFFIALSLLYPKYKSLFIGVAVFVAMSRIVLVQHYLSDVVIGSAIGAFVSYWVYHRYYLHASSAKTFSVVTFKRKVHKRVYAPLMLRKVSNKTNKI
ncbi:MAG: phosphatase PAP2 family protein [Sulfuricurvum sp.]|nr:phosphatase PAP2 family protein [Sulfuricurvum sp.]